MARLPRLIVDGLPHLVSQRVQHQQTLAHDIADRDALLQRLQFAAEEHGVAVHAYALLDTRFDLVVTPSSAAALSRFMQAVARRHSAHFNRRHGRAGSLWAGRFRVAVLEPRSWLLKAMGYVEQQLHRVPPVELADPAARGTWFASSETHHSGEGLVTWLVDPEPYWALGNTPFERQLHYRAFVQQPLPNAEVSQMEGALRGGWALGTVEFLQQISSRSLRPAAPRPSGRPPKRQNI